MRKILLAATAVFALAGAAQAAPNLVVNGGFEDNNLTATSLDAFKAANPGINVVGVQVDGHLPGFGDTVTGWSSEISASYPQGYNLYFFDGDTAKTGDAASIYPGEQQRPNANFTGDSPNGGAFMVLDADPTFTSPFSQMVTGLVVGNSYELSFYWAAGELSNRTGYQTSQLTGSFGNHAFATGIFANSHPIGSPTAGQAGDFSGWELQSFRFKADSTSQLLSFLAVGTPAGNLPPVAFLDGVSVTGVPEPGVWALMMMGFGGLGAVARRRRRLAAA
jgi:hypothetical protein